MKKTVRISTINKKDEEDGVMCNLLVECLDSKRIEHHGFGTFYWHLKKEEIEIDQKAKSYLQKCINREYSSVGDLFGLSIHFDVRKQYGLHLIYGTLDDKLEIPLEDITVDYEAYKMLFE